MLVSGCSGSPPQSSPHPGANPPVAVPLPAEPCPNPVGARGAACTSPCCRGNYRGGTTGVKCLPGAGRGSCACAPGLLEHARAAPAAPHPWSSLLQLPSCTLHQLVSRLALLCLARLLPPPSSHVLLYVPSPAACLQPSGSRGAGSPQWGGGGQQALAALQFTGGCCANPPAAPASSGHPASSSCGTATEGSSSPLCTARQCQAAWGLLPRDEGHAWCAPHSAGCSQHPRSQSWCKQPHARARDGILLWTVTCMAAGDGTVPRGYWCCSVTSPLKCSCPPPVPKAVYSLLCDAQPRSDPAGSGAVLNFHT